MACKTEGGTCFPAGDYAYVPDPSKPSTWKLRLTKSPGGSPDAGIVGAAAAALGPGYRGNTAELPSGDRAKVVNRVRAAWRKANPGKSDEDMPEGIRSGKGSAKHSTFAGTTMVRRQGKIWEAGDYPDKQFWMTPDELAEAVADFSPVAIDLEHLPTVLDGHLGHLVAVEQGADPWELRGDVEIPDWLDELAPGDALKVSATWDRDTKRIEKLALVLDPRISDAAVYSAFAKRHDTPEGQSVMQSIHDRTAAAGAICKRPSATEMSSRHEMSGIQAVHDITTEHGANCGTASTMPMAYYSDPQSVSAAAQAPRRSPMSWISDLFRLAKNAPEDFDPESLAGAFGGQPAAAATQGQTTPPETTTTPAPQFSAKSEREQSLEQELKRERAKGILRNAEDFADDIIRDEKAFQMEREEMIAGYYSRAMDDILYNVATFANGKEELRIDQFKRSYEIRPKHLLTRETLNGDVAKLLFAQLQTNSQQTGDEPAKERIDRLIQMTPLGVAQQNGATSR